MSEAGADDAKQVLEWAWSNKQWIGDKLAELRKWLFSGNKVADSTSSILIIGPGGVGKSTTAQVLAGEHDTLLSIPGQYQESIGLETYALKDDPGIELIVPPGQVHRRDATWHEIQQGISAGHYCGIMIVGSYGYHSLGEISFKHHQLYDGDQARFLKRFVDRCRTDEVRVVERLKPFLCQATNRSWLLSLATKQDLWWPERADAEQFYRTGKYGKQIQEIRAQRGGSRFRHEQVFASLVIRNFTTGESELLAETAGGYDQELQVMSLRRLWETLDALKNWEEST